MVITQNDLRAELQAAVTRSGGVMAFSRAKGLAPTSVSRALNGQRPVSEALANALGYIVETTYRRIGSE